MFGRVGFFALLREFAPSSAVTHAQVRALDSSLTTLKIIEKSRHERACVDSTNSCRERGVGITLFASNPRIQRLKEKLFFSKVRVKQILPESYKASARQILLKRWDSRIFDDKCGLQGKAQGSYLSGSDRSGFSPLPHLSQKAQSLKPTRLVLWILALTLFTACAHKNPNHPESSTAKHTNTPNTADNADNMTETLSPHDLAPTAGKITLTTSQACKPHHTPSALLSFVGDNVLGDYKGSAGATFNAKFKEVGGDVGYFSLGVREVLESDDLSIGNMEGVLSDRALKNAFDKPFSFKGSSRYTQILTAAGFEAMNVANNHSRDYGKQGFEDTIAHLQASDIAVFGEGLIHIYEVNGIKFGLAGHRGWNLGIKEQVKKEIRALRAQGAEIVIFTFHWGEERKHFPNATQRALAHFTIDSGADMVIGHHPHVLQGVEEYKGRKIVYSLGNFIYGGAKNPSDKDSMIYQTRFVRFMPKGRGENLARAQKAKKAQQEFIEDLRFDTCAREAYLDRAFISGVERVDVLGDFVLIHSVIPVSISSTQSYNDYSPRIYEPESKGFARILTRLESYSKNGAREQGKKAKAK